MRKPVTERLNPASKGMDALPTLDVLGLIVEEEGKAVEAVRGRLGRIKRAVDDAVRTIRGGGRVFYIGAGSSGRIGALDASEIPPTFGVDSFRAIMAGGRKAFFRAVEGAEDDRKAGAEAASEIEAKDMAVGISASGRTPFVLSALGAAKKKGALCWLITSGGGLKHPFLDGEIALSTGPEIVSGSTRMKAATAAKITLNMLSTAAMIRLGGVYDGLMIDVAPSNKKLIKRAEGIVMEITGCTARQAARYLRLSGMRAKTAVVMLQKGLSREGAEGLLKRAGGSLRKALSY